MKRILASLATVLALSASYPTSATPAAPGGLTLAFEELWEPRTGATGVFGVVTSATLKSTPDGADPQQAWVANSIRARWGTLHSLDGSVPGLPDVTGLGPNPHWMTRAGKLFFHAAPHKGPNGEATDGFALVSRATFARSQRIVVETELHLSKGSHTAFVGVALIAGEGDYRELALYRGPKGKDTIDRITPLRRSVLARRKADTTTVRIEYDPVAGFSYLVDGRVVGREALDHQGASFGSDPQVGLYFTGNPGVADSFAEGSVGPIRVWVSGTAARL